MGKEKKDDFPDFFEDLDYYLDIFFPLEPYGTADEEIW